MRHTVVTVLLASADRQPANLTYVMSPSPPAFWILISVRWHYFADFRETAWARLETGAGQGRGREVTAVYARPCVHDDIAVLALLPSLTRIR